MAVSYCTHTRTNLLEIKTYLRIYDSLKVPYRAETLKGLQLRARKFFSVKLGDKRCRA